MSITKLLNDQSSSITCCKQKLSVIISNFITPIIQSTAMQIQGVLEPQPRSKELSDRQIKILKTTMQTLQLSGYYAVHYNICTKQSRSGFFNNDRLLILNTRQRYLGYVSKLPEGLLPFWNQQEVKSLKFKCKITRQAVKNAQIKEFKCRPISGKISTFQVFYKIGNRNQIQQWNIQVSHAKLMHEWIELINETLLKDDNRPKSPQKQPQQPKVNNPPPPQPQYQPQPPKQRTQSKKVLNQSVMVQPQTDYKPFEQPPYNSHPIIPPPPPINNSRINFTNISYDEPEVHSSRIANMPYNDHVDELKYLRKEKPEMFNTTNQLSKKRLPEYHEELLENNKNTANAGDGRNSFIKKTNNFVDQNNGGVYHRQGSRKALQNTQQPTEPIKKTRSGLNPNNPTPPIPNNNEYKRYNSQYDNGLTEQPQINILPLSRQKQHQPTQRPAINKTINESLQQEQDPNTRKNITIQSRSREVNSITRNDSAGLNLNLRPAQTPLAKSNLVHRSPSNSRTLNPQNSRRGLSRRKWNEVFAQTNDKLSIYEEFIHTCFNIVREIVNQLALDKNRKDYLPIEVKPPYFTYYTEGIILTLHQFQHNQNISSPAYNQNSPLLYDHSSYDQLKREFYNYNLLLGVTSNQGFIKVPLCGYFEYKGVIALCKAEIPQNFTEVTPKRFQKQFEIIENQIHLRFMFGSFNAYLHPNNKYMILDNMKELIPEIPLPKNQGHFFRKQFLLAYEHIIEDPNAYNEAHDHITHRLAPEVLAKLESLQTYVVNSTDLYGLLHEEGLSLAYLPLLVQLTKSPFLKRIFMSELVSIIFSAVFRSELNNLYNSFPTHEFEEVTLDTISTILIDSSHALLQMMFSYSNNVQNLWKLIVQQCKSKYRVIISKQDLIPGYLLASITERLGLVLDFRRSSFDKHQVQFFAKSDNLPRDLLVGFRIKIRRYDLSAISGSVQTVQSILASDPTPDNFRILLSVLNLKTDSVPNYLQPYEQPLLTYLCNFVPYSQHQQFQHIGIYNMVLLEPHSYHSTKCSLLAIKWCIKKKLIQEAVKIYEMKEVENAFWLGEYNPAISEFYDFFSMYYASVGRYQQSIQLAKLSLKNIMKVVGSAQLPVADKHYQLGNIYFKMGRKEDSLKQYTLTKDILLAHQQTSIAEYAVILLKLSVLYLNFGKIAEAVNQSLEALKIFQSTHGSEQDQIGTFQILSRCYEITKKQPELQNIGDMAGDKFNQTEDPLIFQRMAKLVLYIKLKNLSSAESKAFLAVLSKLQEQTQQINQMQAFSFLHKKCQSQVLMRKVEHYLSNIVYLYEQASKKDLFRRYKTLDTNTRTQAEEMLVTLQVLAVFIGFGYLIGSLRDSYE